MVDRYNTVKRRDGEGNKKKQKSCKSTINKLMRGRCLRDVPVLFSSHKSFERRRFTKKKCICVCKYSLSLTLYHHITITYFTHPHSNNPFEAKDMHITILYEKEKSRPCKRQHIVLCRSNGMLRQRAPQQTLNAFRMLWYFSVKLHFTRMQACTRSFTAASWWWRLWLVHLEWVLQNGM